jgi:hypothetical protein
MEHDGKSRRWRMSRVLGAAALAAGLLAVGLPAGAAHASTVPASPAASTPTQYSLDLLSSAKALGHSWNVEFSAGESVGVLLATVNKGVSEQHQWMTTGGFNATKAKELKVTSTGHATFATGKALSPVLSVTLKFTPAKATKSACTKGSDTVYTGRVTGSLTLVTGLKKVKIALKFANTAGASLDVDKGCQPKLSYKTACDGGSWFVGASGIESAVLAEQKPLTKVWQDVLAQGPFKTANKWVNRSALVEVSGPAPKLNTATKTVAVSALASGAITGSGVISYTGSFPVPASTCYLGGKKYTETGTQYSGSVKVSKPFQAHSLLAGTLTPKAPKIGFFNAVKLTAA